MIRTCASQPGTLRDDERGAVGMLFALSLTAVIMLIGCAIDYGRMIHASMKMGNAVDAATLAAAKKLRDGSMSTADVKLFARRFYDQNMLGSGNYAAVTAFDVDIDDKNSSVTVKIKSQMPTAFMRVAGINTVNLPQGATALYKSQDIEVGLQLDVTGSMSGSIGGKVKITALKDATNDLLEILLPDSGTPNKVRVGIAPFAAGVNAGSYAKAVSGSRSSDCVYERQSASNDATDAAPLGFDSLKAKSDLSGGAQPCPGGVKVTALTDKKAALKTVVNSMSAGGSTAGHLGSAWAWYLVSPTWSSIWPGVSKPAAYDDGFTVKTVVLMTDGIYNTVGGVNGGDYSATAVDAQKRAKNLCDGMRAKKIVIYTVGFIGPGDPPAAADTLIACAGTTGKFFKAENADELRAAFRSIAEDISKLRLAK